ncbi:hypothetical protein [Enterobacter sp. 638]|uniref:hypothetical protein n=1 Tax=Enterobacter sp. (strain 638) TaxID=399742 RepID=UPI0005A19576|nr:hypothetical protein [Enterobacter sp. 638]
MTTISIAHDVTDETIAEIQSLLDEVSVRDIAWNGVEFEIERGDFTCIESDESAEAVILLRKINKIIDGY